MFDFFKRWMPSWNEPREERQIKWEVELEGKTTNEKIVAFCKDPTSIIRKTEPPLDWSKDAINNLRLDMFDPWGNVNIYRGKPVFKIRE